MNAKTKTVMKVVMAKLKLLSQESKRQYQFPYNSNIRRVQ